MISVVSTDKISENGFCVETKTDDVGSIFEYHFENFFLEFLVLI